MNEPDYDKVFSELGFDRADFDEPTMTEKLEGMRTAVAFVRFIDQNRLADLLRYWSGLDEYEQGCAIGALGQLSLVGCHAMAAVNGLELDGQLVKMEAELAAAVEDGDMP